jgi:hypothetical protein
MTNLIVILLAIIAYFLWKIYRQKEDEREAIANEKFKAEWEAKEKERFKNYPHLYNKLDITWLEVFAGVAEKNLPLLKAAFFLMLNGSTKIDLSEGSLKYDRLWDLTEELLEHLEKFHEGSVTEFEIAVCTYWQIAAMEIGKLVEESPNKTVRPGEKPSSSYTTAPIDGKKIEAEPFTNIAKIVSLFPKKANHPAEEISFVDDKGVFPRESKGSEFIRKKLKNLGL